MTQKVGLLHRVIAQAQVSELLRFAALFVPRHSPARAEP